MQRCFKFYHEDNLNLLYVATLEDDIYFVSWQDEDGIGETDFKADTVERLIENRTWIIVSEEDEIETNNEDIKTKVYERVIKFMKDNSVSCVETIHQCDWVILNAYDFMSDLYEIVESELPVIEE